jgi:hypothetical protein
MPCQCSVSESCPSCECSISLPRQRCDLKSDCIYEVGHCVTSTVIGSLKLYIINLVVKNCTKKTLTNFHISLDLKTALMDFPTIQTCDASPSGNCDGPSVGILTLEPANVACLLQGLAITSAPYRPNLAFDGLISTSLIESHTIGNVRLPPGESAFTVRFFAPSSTVLVNPIVTVSACVPCCHPLRKTITLQADCVPAILDKTNACWLDACTA